jgi:hypothetical protein
MSIPAFLDHLAILDDLNRLGWLDSKIETSCGFSQGYVAQLRCRNVKNMSYHRAARLFNFWEDEAALRIQSPVGTT